MKSVMKYQPYSAWVFLALNNAGAHKIHKNNTWSWESGGAAKTSLNFEKVQNINPR